MIYRRLEVCLRNPDANNLADLKGTVAQVFLLTSVPDWGFFYITPKKPTLPASVQTVMKRVLLTSQSGVLRKLPVRPRARRLYTYEYTKQTEHSQQQTSSGLFQTCFLSCSRPPAFFLFTVRILASQFIFRAKLLSLFYRDPCFSHQLLFLPVSVYSFWIRTQWGPWIRIRNQEGKNDPQKRKT